ncbi:unnamed protein product, partial [Symbiodinium natans]
PLPQPRRPLSARLEHREVEDVPPLPVDGIANVLVSSLRETEGRGLPPELRCPEAAIQHLAPGTRLRPCRSTSCCWRWVATKLLDECLSAAAKAVILRKTLDEELGDSILQQLLNLEGDHEALQERLGHVRSQFDLERAARSALEEKLADMGVQLQEAVEKSQRSARAESRAVSARLAAEEKVSELQNELDLQAKNTPEELKRRTLAAEAEVERIRAESE